MCHEVIFEEFRITRNVVVCVGLSVTCWGEGGRVPGLASDENLAGVHDAAGQAGGVDGAQRRAELDYVGPDQGLWEQARVLPGGRGFVLTCTWAKFCRLSITSVKSCREFVRCSFHFFCECEIGQLGP